jgi:hypothetical protein
MEAGALARLLDQEEIVRAALRYKKADAAANAAQQRYKRLNLMTIGLRVLAIAVGFLLLVPTDLKIEYLRMAERASAADRWAVAFQFLALAGALAMGVTIGKLKLFRRWMTFRAKAERIRQQYFELIMSTNMRVSKGETALLPLKLDYFTRHHLIAQREYYSRRGREHWRKARRTRWWMAAMQWLAILSIVPVIWVIFEAAGILEIPDISRYFLALGTVAAVILGALDSISEANLDARNAARYAIVTENLKFLEERELPEAQGAAAKGKAAVVRTFVERVNREIALEHREWRFLRDEFQRQAASEAALPQS